ncbi:hypothetical protein F4703DRAFT_1849489 [Phycomyces blakesleeanus]
MPIPMYSEMNDYDDHQYWDQDLYHEDEYYPPVTHSREGYYSPPHSYYDPQDNVRYLGQKKNILESKEQELKMHILKENMNLDLDECHILAEENALRNEQASSLYRSPVSSLPQQQQQQQHEKEGKQDIQFSGHHDEQIPQKKSRWTFPTLFRRLVFTNPCPEPQLTQLTHLKDIWVFRSLPTGENMPVWTGFDYANQSLLTEHSQDPQGVEITDSHISQGQLPVLVLPHRSLG